MCGIGLVKRNDGHSPLKPLLQRYEEQKTRGTQGFGFVAVKNGIVVGYERSTTEEEIIEKLSKYSDSDEILFHHRLPTSTGNYEETAHPIKVSNPSLKYDYYVVHNGVIRNPDELKVKHEELGFEYNTEIEVISGYRKKKVNGKKQKVEVVKTEFNDSESLAIEIALYLDGKKETIDAAGSIAFMCYQVEKKSKKVVSLNYARNTNPIMAFRAHGMFTLWSQSKIKEAYLVEDNKLMTVDYKNNSVSSKHVLLKTWVGATASPSVPTPYSSTNKTQSSGFSCFPVQDDSHVMHIKPCPHGSNSSILCSKCAEDKITNYGKCEECRNWRSQCTCDKNRKLPFTMTEKDGNQMCVLCEEDIRMGSVGIFDRVLKAWVHTECRQSTERVDDLRDKILDKESRIDEINSMTEQLEVTVELLKSSNDANMIEEWFKKADELEKLETEKKRLLEEISEIEKFITNMVF